MLAQIVINCETEIVGFDVESIGFDIGEIDIAIGSTDAEDDEPALNELVSDTAVSVVGDLWLLGNHRVLCADATEAPSIALLMAGVCAAAVFTDSPFGCKIDGFVAGKRRHREFVMASGEMSDDEVLIVFTAFIKAFLPSLKSGAVVYLVIDWRSLHLLLDAARPLLGKLLNLAVWTKDRAGMGSWLRSQHELILIFKAGSGRYRNNVQLGKFGRNRSNVWPYPSAKTASTGSDEGDILAAHPTPKPVRLVADAILDCTKRNDVILDVFLGSGTTLIAAEKVGRRCYATELDPLYVDLAIRRWQAWTGERRRTPSPARPSISSRSSAPLHFNHAPRRSPAARPGDLTCRIDQTRISRRKSRRAIMRAATPDRLSTGRSSPGRCATASASIARRPRS